MNKEDYSKYYIQGSDHYLIPKDVFIELFEEMKNWREEAKELKKQLKELEEHSANAINKQVSRGVDLVNQQKEFIEYLENEKDRLARECSQIYEDSLGKTRYVNEDIFDEVNDVLQKYKEIIGVLDEKNN